MGHGRVGDARSISDHSSWFLSSPSSRVTSSTDTISDHICPILSLQIISWPAADLRTDYPLDDFARQVGSYLIEKILLPLEISKSVFETCLVVL